MSDIPSVTLPSGAKMPAFGLGTWRMGNERSRRRQETDAIAHAIDIGYPMIDTAEMYGEGVAEESIADALQGRKRDAIYLVSKVYPHNASKLGTVAACERSLKRLKTDRIDLYLLHWRGGHPLAETLAGFHDLMKAGKIRSFGVSNFDVSDMKEWLALNGAAKGAAATQANQVLYNVTARGIDFDLIPWQAERSIPVMAYSPLAQGGLPRSKGLQAVAARHQATVAQVMLAWCIRRPGVFAVPKTSRVEAIRENAAAASVGLTAADLAEIDRDFPAPRQAKPLEML